MKKRENVKSVFGTYTIEADQIDVNFKSDPIAITDYILRDPQYKSLQNEIEQVHNNSLIQFDPKTYLENKRKDIERIALELQKQFTNDFSELLSKSYTQSEARKIATEQIQKKKEYFMNIHKKQFPKDISQLNLK